MQERPVEVLGEGHGGHHQLAVRRGHDGGQHRDQHDPGDPRVEQQTAERDVHGVRGGQRRGQLADAGESDEGGAGEDEDHPAGADAAGGGDVPGAADAHEAGQDVRLAEVAEPPGQQRDDRHHPERPLGRPGSVREGDAGAELAQRGLSAVEGVPEGAEAAETRDRDGGQHDQAEQHQRGLQHMREAHREEAAQARVDDDQQPGEGDADGEAQVEDGPEQQPARHQTAGDVHGEEDEGDGGGDQSQHARAVLEPLLQIPGQGHRVPRPLGVGAQTRRDEQPVQVRPHGQADGEPHGAEPGRVDGAGERQEQPAGHVAGARGQSGDPGTEAAAAEGEVLEGVRARVGPDPRPDQGEHVQDERGDDRRAQLEHVVLARKPRDVRHTLGPAGKT